MKARTINKLRKKIAQFKSYEVYEAIHLFGEPFEFKFCVKSDSPKNALKRPDIKKRIVKHDFGGTFIERIK